MSRIPSALAAVIAAACLCAGPAAAGQAEADAYYAEQNWRAAEREYSALVAGDPSNAQNWYRLGAARLRTGKFAEARDAFQAAIDAGFQPAVRARIGLARAHAALGDIDAALTELEAVAEAGGVTHRSLEAQPEFAALSSEPRYLAVIERLRPCNTDEYRQFDFWLGEWDVTQPGASAPSATNSISVAQEGCVVLEQYTAGAFTGMSINFYDRQTGKWHQTWMSNAGGAVYLEGALTEDGAMQMSDADLPVSGVTGSINRVTWTPNADGSVRQHWENSSDSGATWTTSFDGRYTKRKASD